PSCISGVNRCHRNVGRRAWRGCLGAHRIGGRKSADRPTPAPPLVGWSTPRVGHRVGLRCPPYRRPEKRRPPYPPRPPSRVVNAPRWPPGGASVPTVSAAGKAPTALRPRRPL